MKFHIITIQDRKTDDTVFHGFDYAALRLHVATYCRENWPHEMTDDTGEQAPEDNEELITAYFHEHDREFLIEQEFEIQLPQPYAIAPCLLDTLGDCTGVLQSIENQLKGKSFAVTAVLLKARATIAKSTV